MEKEEIFDLNEDSSVTYEDMEAFEGIIDINECKYCTHYLGKDKLGYVTCRCLEKAFEEDLEREENHLKALYQKEYWKSGNFEFLDLHDFGFTCNHFKE